MPHLLLRHVHAGDRDAFAGDDRRRPASARGRRQAEALIASFAEFPIARILTSPYTRCVQSVEPLAAALGLPVEETDELAEGASLDLVWRLFARLGDEVAVLCSHGDVVGSVVQDWHYRGVNLGAEGPRWEKASTWVVEGDPRLPSVHYLPPPA